MSAPWPESDVLWMREFEHRMRVLRTDYDRLWRRFNAVGSDQGYEVLGVRQPVYLDSSGLTTSQSPRKKCDFSAESPHKAVRNMSETNLTPGTYYRVCPGNARLGGLFQFGTETPWVTLHPLSEFAVPYSEYALLDGLIFVVATPPTLGAPNHAERGFVSMSINSTSTARCLVVSSVQPDVESSVRYRLIDNTFFYRDDLDVYSYDDDIARYYIDEDKVVFEIRYLREFDFSSSGIDCEDAGPPFVGRVVFDVVEGTV